MDVQYTLEYFIVAYLVLFVLLVTLIALSILIVKLLNRIIMTEQEAIDKINSLTTQVGKVKTEVEALIAAAENQGNVSEALATAIENAKTALQGVDDLNPDTNPPA